MTLPALGIGLHQLAALVWVGGMFFAYLVLRPAAGPLAGGERLHLWRRVFARFLPMVWASVIVLLVSGYGLILATGGFAAAGLHVHLMQATGILMMLIFLHLYFAPWRRLCRGLDAGDLEAAGRALGQIRTLVAINLSLGVLTVLIGSTGRYWG
jgi:uncharacterized membrane protein